MKPNIGLWLTYLSFTDAFIFSRARPCNLLPWYSHGLIPVPTANKRISEIIACITERGVKAWYTLPQRTSKKSTWKGTLQNLSLIMPFDLKKNHIRSVNESILYITYTFFSGMNNAYFLLLLLQWFQYILPATHTPRPAKAVLLSQICSWANSLRIEPCLSFMLRCTLPMTLSARFKRNSVSCGWEPRRLYSPSCIYLRYCWLRVFSSFSRRHNSHFHLSTHCSICRNRTSSSSVPMCSACQSSGSCTCSKYVSDASKESPPSSATLHRHS